MVLSAEQMVTSIESINENIVTDFSLKQNYPNPFNPATTIEFSLLNNSKVVLTVYNVLGQKVKELLNAELKQGVYHIDLNAEHLSSGLYFYELKSEGQSKILKMSLIK